MSKRVVDGVVTGSSINGVTFKKDIVSPKGRNNVRTLRPMVAKGITVHSTANTAKSAGDEAHGVFLQNVETSDKGDLGFHFAVDKDSISQYIPINELTYHAGDGYSGFGNTKTIGIEICENDNIPLAIENAKKLVVFLQAELGIPTDLVMPHLYYSTWQKVCPRVIIRSVRTWKDDWEGFQTSLDVLTGQLYGGVKSPPVSPVSPSKGSTPLNKVEFKVGDIVEVRKTAKTWSTGQAIPTFVKGKKYPVKQVKGDKVLLGEVVSWVLAKDIVRVGSVGNRIKVGSKVRIRKAAHTYASGVAMSSWVKGQVFTVTDLNATGALLSPIQSRVWLKDLELV